MKSHSNVVIGVLILYYPVPTKYGAKEPSAHEGVLIFIDQV